MISYATNPKLINRDARKDIYIKSMGMLDFARYNTLKRYRNTVVSYEDYQYAFELTRKVVKVMRAKRNKKVDDIFTYNFIASCADKSPDSIKAMVEGDDINRITKSIMEFAMSKLVGFDVVFRQVKNYNKGEEYDCCYILEDIEFSLKAMNRSFGNVNK